MSVHHRTIYKRTSTGAIQEWHIEQDGDRYRAVSGQKNGKLVEAGWTRADPKNVGKSNETDGLQQAELEIEAAYKKKLAQGKYHETIADIDDAKFVAPMLAKDFKKDFPYAGDSSYPSDAVFDQRKFDGVRAVATKDGLFSRQGKPITSCPHIMRALQPAFDENPDLIFDGELYTDKLADNFNEIISLVRKQNPVAARLAKAEEFIQYFVYDLPSFLGTFSERFAELKRVKAMNVAYTSFIKIAETRAVPDKATLDANYAEYMAEGYEGQIIRINNSAYENKRSKQLLKRKEFMDAEFEIVEIVEGSGNRNGMAGRITYLLPSGEEFGSGIRGSHAWCVELLKNADAYKGGVGTVRFQDYTPDGVPRFPVTVAVFENERDV